jgi:hypothetical protein
VARYQISEVLLPRVRLTFSVTSFLCCIGAAVAGDPGPKPGLRFDYVRAQGADSCPDRAAVAAAVTARLGYDAFSAEGAKILRCRVAGAGSGLTSRIELVDEAGGTTGVRTLASDRNDCRDLSEAMVLVLTLAARPQAAAKAPALPATAEPAGDAPPVATSPATSSDAPASAPTLANEGAGDASSTAVSAAVARARALPSSAPQSLARSPSARVPAPRRPLALQAGLGAVAGVGAGPGLAWGGTAVVGLKGDSLSLSIEPRFDVPVSVATDTGTGEVHFFTASASLVPCLHLGSLAGCGVLGAGLLRGRGENVLGARSGTGPWLSAGARLAWQLPLGPSSDLRIHAEVLALPVRTVLRVGDEAVWATPRLSGTAGLSFVRSFR